MVDFYVRFLDCLSLCRLRPSMVSFFISFKDFRMFPFGTHFWGFTKALVVHTLVSFSVYGIPVVMYISVFSRYCQRWYPAFVTSFVRFCSVLIYRAYMLLWDLWGILIDPSLIFYRNTYVSNWKVPFASFRRPQCMLCYPQVVKLCGK